MAIHISIGNAAGDGFLIAPLGANYDAEISLWADSGTPSVTLQASPNVANLAFSSTGPFTLTNAPKVWATVHSLLQSMSRKDTTIQVLDAGMAVVASFTVTSIKKPVVNFSGRFEARFATDTDLPYINPMYTDADPVGHTANNDPVPLSNGRTFALEGEPPFVPMAGLVPTNLDMTGVGRNVLLNRSVPLRSHTAAITSSVVSISGDTMTTTGEIFPAGDPLIGQLVNFGPDTYMASNNNGTDTPGSPIPGSPTPEECWTGGTEPLGLFEIQIGTAPFTPPAIYFLGASKVGPFIAKATVVDQGTRSPDSRPFATLHSLPDPMLPPGVGDFAAFGIPSDLQTFVDKRLNALVADYPLLPPGPSLQRRNLVRRIDHLLACLAQNYPGDPLIGSVPPKAVAPDSFTTNRNGGFPIDYQGLEQYKGKVDTALHAWPGASPGASSVVAYLTQFFSFDFEWDPFAFNTDENCGYHTGTLTGDLTMTGNHIGDVHVHTVDGTAYDFQAVGEFTLLRDGERMEIQVRQWPVPTANPVTDAHSGLTECVSINTAVAVRMGRHRISLQQAPQGPALDRQGLEFYVDGKPAAMPFHGIDLGSSRVIAFAANGETGIRVDFPDGTEVLITPVLWFSNVWYLDVSVSNTSADEGVMGYVPKESWLPRLRNGVDVGPRPASLHERYVMLYKTFADSWRVTEKTSLFVYAPGTSTATFTDTDWPAEKLPCKLKPGFGLPGGKVFQGMPVERAEVICRIVTDKALYKNCVFDVATTGDETFAKGYVFAEELRLYSTSVKIACHLGLNQRPYQSPRATANVPAQSVRATLVTVAVSPLTRGRPIPTGCVTVFIDDVPMNRAIPLDGRGRARVKIAGLKPGEHRFRATYSGCGKYDYHSSSSPTIVCRAGSKEPVKPPTGDKVTAD